MELPSLDLKNPTANDGVETMLVKMTMDPGKIQDQVLKEILSKNSKTEYLSRYLSDDDDQVDDDDVKQVFKKKVPLIEYTDLLPYIERVANGEPHQIVSADPILELIFRPLRGTITSLIKHNLAKAPYLNPPIATSPPEVLMCEDVKQTTYCQLLCGLLMRESVMIVGTIFGGGFVRMIKFLEQHWEELCDNIRQGRISDWIDDPKCRGAVSDILSSPMPELADAISKECESESWEGIVKKLWPGAKCIEAVVTGSMAQYIPQVEFYSGGLPIVSTVYASSEGVFGINLQPLCDPYDVSYCLVPWMAYYEFLPVDPISEDDADVVDLVNVKIGRHYELVVTTFSAFHNNAPEFRFVRRKNVILSINPEKTTEEDLIKATSKAIHNILEPHGFLLADYTSYADSHSFPGHYALFWELLQNHGEPGVQDNNGFVEMMKGCCNVVDESLDETYRCYRTANVIGPLEIKVVKQGTFDALMDFTLSRQKYTSPSQYKTPKSVTSEDAIGLLNSMAIATFFSDRMA
ncbi:OLC1v1019570C1 [Oldenlandia corymbosa var. corymbosa]|uniref:OLC1v1019570C1 n=1 Tax=Oldenlandia corymbosa var. corymbosa TaxID=529605 RepID=A0AAV1EE86_OLDCO|nr:OLC1v1019570C1 [Oldenlandia corymbosa var. corymbosa]